MVTFLVEFGFSDVMDRIMERIVYIAGKCSRDEEGYYRLWSGDADKGLLRSLILRAMSSLAIRLGRRLQEMVLRMDEVSMSLTGSREAALKSEMLAEMVVSWVENYVVGKWISISDMEAGETILDECEVILGHLMDALRTKVAKPRKS